MKKKIFLIGLNLYSIFLAINIRSKSKNFDITILEGSNNFLQAFKPIKIAKYFINPGFHAFENIRSKSLLIFLKKIIKLRKLNKTRGIIIDNHLISYQDKYSNWPEEIIKKFKLKKNKLVYSKITEADFADKIYIKYIKKNVSDNRMSLDSAFDFSYPWFFPPNYQIASKDEAALFNQKVREKKIKHSYIFPSGGLFENISKNLRELMNKKNIKIKLNTQIKFFKKKNQLYFDGLSELNIKKNIKIICVPVKPLSASINDNKLKKIKKLNPIKYFTGLVEIKNFVKSDLDKFSEIIVASKYALGLKRISLYSDIFDVEKKKIYQIEFLEHSKCKDLTKQINDILLFMTKFVKFKNSKNKNINLIGYYFVRNIFGPKKDELKFITKKTNIFFKKKKNIFFPRSILWPINSNKHFTYAKKDYNNIIQHKLQ